MGTNLNWVSNKTYYSWVDNFLYTDEIKECPPPYTDYTNPHCFDYSILGTGGTPEIFKCYTGFIPYYCPTLT